MSLDFYRKPDLLALNASRSALEAARALENNDVGAVIVQEGGRVVGIVTDRDLSLRVVGYALDPRTTTLAEAMTSPVATLTPSDSELDAVALMQTRGIRRIPLVEDGRLVGIVTLDDLLLDEAVPMDEVAAAVQAQIGAGRPGPPAYTPEERRPGRAEATLGRFLRRLTEAAKLESRAQAIVLLDLVLTHLVRRLTPDEADDFIAQLPSLLQPKLRNNLVGPDKEITSQSVQQEVARRLDVDASRASELIAAVWKTVGQVVSRGELEDVLRQLPGDFRTALDGAAASLP